MVLADSAGVSFVHEKVLVVDCPVVDQLQERQLGLPADDEGHPVEPFESDRCCCPGRMVAPAEVALMKLVEQETRLEKTFD